MPGTGTWCCAPLLVALGVAPLCGQTASVQEVAQIGAVDGPVETAWVRVDDATILAGHVFVVDAGAPAVRMFTLAGDFVGNVGREGQGPGEYLRPVSITVVADSVWVYDAFQERVSVFDRRGRFGRTVRTQPEGTDARVFIRRAWPLGEGWTVGETSMGGSDSGAEGAVHHVLAWSHERIDTVASYGGNPLYFHYAGHGHDRLVMCQICDLAPNGGIWVLGDSLLVFVDGVRPAVELLALTETGLESVRSDPLPGAPMQIDTESGHDVEAWYYEATGLGPQEMIDGNVQAILPPSSLGAWSNPVGDENGHIWIREGSRRRLSLEEGDRWLRWSPSEGVIGELVVPLGVDVLQIREGHLVGTRRGPFGIETVVVLSFETGGR